MLQPMLSDTMLFHEPMRLADALFCLDCEVMFTSLESCPSCAGSAIWPVAAAGAIYLDRIRRASP